MEPATERPPAKVEVAVVLVARYAAAVGVEVETTLPEPSVESNICAPVPETVSAFVV